MEVPKRPVRRGRRGWDIPRLKLLSPRNPARVNMRIAFILDFFSL